MNDPQDPAAPRRNHDKDLPAYAAGESPKAPSESNDTGGEGRSTGATGPAGTPSTAAGPAGTSAHPRDAAPGPGATAPHAPETPAGAHRTPRAAPHGEGEASRSDSAQRAVEQPFEAAARPGEDTHKFKRAWNSPAVLAGVAIVVVLLIVLL